MWLVAWVGVLKELAKNKRLIESFPLIFDGGNESLWVNVFRFLVGTVVASGYSL